MTPEKQNEIVAALKAKLEEINSKPFSVDAILQEAKEYVDNAMSWIAVKESLKESALAECDSFIESARPELEKIKVKINLNKYSSGDVNVEFESSGGHKKVDIKMLFRGHEKHLGGHGDFLEDVSTYWVANRSEYKSLSEAAQSTYVQAFLMRQAIGNQYVIAKNQQA